MSNRPRVSVKRQRGPYRKYLDRCSKSMQNDDQIPRTTSFDKKKRFSQAYSDMVQEIDGAVGQDILHVTNNSSCYIENPAIHQASHYQAENITHAADSSSCIDDSVNTNLEQVEAEESTDQESHHDQADNITDQESVDGTDNDNDYIVGNNFGQSSFIDQRLNLTTTFRSELDVEEIETYSVFENQCPCTSSERGTIADDNHDEEINDNDPADDLQNGGPADDPQDDYFSERLCQCTSTNRGEAIMAVLTLAIRHSWTWVGIVDMLKTINALFGNDVVPATKYKLFKYFAIQSDYFRYHIICPKCEALLGEQSQLSERESKLCKCGHEVKAADMESFFLSAGFDKQLRTVLQTPGVSQNLNYRHTRHIPNEGDLTDIYDGKIYKSLSAEGQPLSFAYNLSYTFNTDGCQASNSSATSLWPIYATINELPPLLRSKHMILVGIWACQRKPEMTSFLQPFVEDARELSNKGIIWEMDGTGVVTSKVFAICSSVDSVARSAMLNMKQFNGYYGCTMCEHPGELVQHDKTGRKSVKYAVSAHVPPDRTHESIVNNMKLAYDITKANKQTTSVKGVFGPSPLMNLMHFDLSQGLPPDSLHLIAGLMKQYTNMIVTDVGEDYYVGAPNVLKVIDERLRDFTPPICITRTPRSLKDRALWKASEWRSWLIFYALICLRGILPQKYIVHLSMLVTAIRILLDEKISREQLHNAHTLLIKFVVLFQTYFGKNSMNYNVHLLLHVCRGVENYGPLWTHNTYSFENENRYILQHKKSPTHLALQICQRFVMYKAVNNFGYRCNASNRMKQFCEALSHNRLRSALKTEDCTLIGRSKSCSLDAEELACSPVREFDVCESYHTLIAGNNFRYDSTLDKQATKTNNTVAMTVIGTFVIIEKICKILKVNETPRVIVFCRELQVVDESFLTIDDVSVNHIKRCGDMNSAILRAYSPEMLKVPCNLIKTNYGTFVMSIPRGCLGD